MFVVISNLIGHMTPIKAIDPNNQVILCYFSCHCSTGLRFGATEHLKGL